MDFNSVMQEFRTNGNFDNSASTTAGHDHMCVSHIRLSHRVMNDPY